MGISVVFNFLNVPLDVTLSEPEFTELKNGQNDPTKKNKESYIPDHKIQIPSPNPNFKFQDPTSKFQNPGFKF